MAHKAMWGLMHGLIKGLPDRREYCAALNNDHGEQDAEIPDEGKTPPGQKAQCKSVNQAQQTPNRGGIVQWKKLTEQTQAWTIRRER